jgi:hypothetical protein
MEVTAVIMTKKKPVAAVGHITVKHGAVRQCEGNMVVQAKGGDIRNTDASIVVELGSHTTGWSIDGICASTNAPEMGEGGDESDGAVATHAEVADIVEKNHPEIGIRVMGWAEVSANDDVVATWLKHDTPANSIVVGAEPCHTVGKWLYGQVREPTENDTCGFAGGV